MSLCKFEFEFAFVPLLQAERQKEGQENSPPYHSDFAAVGMQGPFVKEHMIPKKHMISGWHL
jgi:hypothetical protein